MSQIAIEAHDIRKQYAIGQRFQYKTLRDSVASMIVNAVPYAGNHRNGTESVINDQGSVERSSFWALDGISFDLEQGDVLGIVGRNGAGKSTLLKILSRITEPTHGYAIVRGRVGSLLEVGSGFHPELTGRENVFLNGAILGMRSAEIKRKMNDIIEFASIEKFIDTPVKFYSSGMHLRLAFSVAAHLDSEILLVDETLAVGDAEFQMKCVGKMNDLARQGRTVVFVSHNLLAIQDLCQQVMWIDAGKVVEVGPSRAVISRYLQKQLRPETERSWKDAVSVPGTEHVRLERARIVPADQDPGAPITVRTRFGIQYDYTVLAAVPSVYLCIFVYNEQGLLLFNSGPARQPKWRERPVQPGMYRETCFIPGDLLNDGLHRVAISIFDNGATYHLEDMLTFDVVDTVGVRDHWYGKWEGAMRPILEWDGSRIANGAPPRLERIVPKARE